MKTIKVSKLKKGSNVFQSHGISKVKMTEIIEVEKDGVMEQKQEMVCLEIPIQSTGISELINTFREKAPIPPTFNKLVEPDSEIGLGLGLTKKNGVKMFDLTDPDYVKAKEDHDSDLGIAIVLKGLAVPLLDEEDKEITGRDDKIKTLKEMGISTAETIRMI